MAKFTLSLDGPSLKLPKDVVTTSFDYSGRYRLIGEILKRYYADHPKDLKNVLDVGGLGGFLGRIVDAKVVIYDNEAEEGGAETKGDGSNMKAIKDGQFSAVVTSDTLEHIPKPDRKKFVNELIRASDDLVILCAPFGDHGAAEAEKAVQKTYQHFSGHEHRWLAEHKQFGLPKEAEIVQYFKAQKLSVVVIHQSSLYIWRTLMTINLMANEIDDDGIRRQVRQLNAYYNEHLFANDFTKDSYRTFIVASKKSDLTLKSPSSTIPQNQIQEFTELVADFYGQLMATSKQIPSVAGYLKTTEEQKRDAEAKLHGALEELHTITHSKSWRVTAGPRKVLKASGQVKRGLGKARNAQK
jgi:hypothetical protein